MTEPRREKSTAAFVPAGYFVLRTPLLPLAELEALGSAAEQVRGRLRALVARADVREALFVASPSLEHSLAAWLHEPEGERGQRVERTLVRYVARMAGRATPFGLFAACTLGSVASAAERGSTRLDLETSTRWQRHTRLDIDYLCALIDALTHDRELRAALAFRPNTSLYRVAGRLRYAEARLSGKTRTYALSAVEATSYLEATLERSRAGALAADLAAALVFDDPDVTIEEASAYIDELIDSQVLVPDMAARVTGREPIHELVDELVRVPRGRAVAQRLQAAQVALEGLDTAGRPAMPEQYRTIAGALEDLPVEPDLARLFQVDMIGSAREARLGPEPIAEILRGVDILHRLSPAPGQDRLSRFRQAFIKRYESREVPVTEVLDEESGIGLALSGAAGAGASPLLANMNLASSPGEIEPTPWTARDAFLLGRLQEVVRSGSAELELGPADLEALATPEQAPLPDAFSVMATLLASSPEALTAGDFNVLIEWAAGPSGAQLLGRFCHADPALAMRVREHLAAEEALRPDAIFAEIVHLPEGRAGNVLLRPLLRRHEIPFLGNPGAPDELRIPVTDLYVSAQGDRLVLRSARLGREVIPRLTTAHNYADRGLGLYRFLCLLQHQGVASELAWSWGPLRQAPFLPRVTAGRLVLARASWRLGAADIRPLAVATSRERGYEAVHMLAGRLGLPSRFLVGNGDNLLPVDIGNELSLDSFVHLVRQHRQVALQELLPGPGELCVNGADGSRVHEMIVPFVRRAPEPPAQQPAPRRLARAGSLPRTFTPGSEWLYAKLYAGTGGVDTALRRVAAPLVAKARASGAADSWFFVRYGDPDWHLRLRFRGNPGRLAAEVLPALHAAAAPLMASGVLARVELGTYEREVERYGGSEGILLAEQIFHADSEAVLGMIELLDGDAGADARWRLALLGMDFLLDDLGLELGERRGLLARLRASYGRELRADVAVERKLGERYRGERAKLESLLDPARHDAGELEPGVVLLRRRSERLRPIMAALRAAVAGDRLNVSLADMTASLLHMHANRLLQARPREHEFVLYDFLFRIYESRIARQRR